MVELSRFLLSAIVFIVVEKLAYNDFQCDEALKNAEENESF